MRIIRTRRGAGLPQHEETVKKGWVREGILSGLAVEPATVTELASRLGIAKSTASYHVSLLVSKGVVQVIDTTEARGGVQMKRYGLREGSYVTLLSRKDEEAELGRLRETFDLRALSWESSAAAVDLQEVQGLLYRMFLHLFRISRSEHSTLMRDYGRRTGGIMARRLPERPLKESLLGLTAQLASTGLSDSDVLEVPSSGVSLIVSNTCIGSTFHPSNACYFLQGMIEGAVLGKLGPNVKVGRVTVPEVPSCLFAVGRVKRLEGAWLAEAFLTSSVYAAINRGRVKA